MRNMSTFDVKTLRARQTGYDTATTSACPWPCYGTPELKHPGSPNLYDPAST